MLAGALAVTPASWTDEDESLQLSGSGLFRLWWSALPLAMGIFSKLQFSVDFGTRLPWKEKQAVRRALLDNDGILSYILTKKVDPLRRTLLAVLGGPGSWRSLFFLNRCFLCCIYQFTRCSGYRSENRTSTTRSHFRYFAHTCKSGNHLTSGWRKDTLKSRLFPEQRRQYPACMRVSQVALISWFTPCLYDIMQPQANRIDNKNKNKKYMVTLLQTRRHGNTVDRGLDIIWTDTKQQQQFQKNNSHTPPSYYAKLFVLILFHQQW